MFGNPWARKAAMIAWALAAYSWSEASCAANSKPGVDSNKLAPTTSATQATPAAQVSPAGPVSPLAQASPVPTPLVPVQLHAAPIHAIESEDDRPLPCQWVDARGNIVNIPVEIHPQWVWRKGQDSRPGAPSEVPGLRIWLDTLPGAVSHLEAVDPKMIVKEPGEPPFAPKGTFVAADVDAPKLAVGVPFKVRSKKGTDAQEVSLVAIAEAGSEQPSQLVHNSCRELGLHLRERVQPGLLYTGIFCEDAGDKIRLFWQHSKEIEVKSGTLGEPLGKGTEWIAYGVSKSTLSSDAKKLGSLQMDFAKKGKGAAEVFYTPPDRRFSFSPGVGMTYISYMEPANNINLTELGITAKLTGTYYLLRRKVFLDLTAYLTLLPFTLSPSGLNPARFFGANFRSGYRLPIKGSALQVQAVLGYYFWQMWVPDNSYGIKFLSGPQFQATVRYQKAKSRAIFGYLKFAPLADSGFKLDVANSEVALGVGYQLSAPTAKRVWNLTGDFSWAHFSFENQVDSMTLKTASLGIQTVF